LRAGSETRLLPVLLGALLLALPGAGARAQVISSIGQFSTTCQTDDQIAASDRAAIDAAALRYVREIFGTNPASAYDNFAAIAKRSVTREEFAAKIGPLVWPLQPFADLQVTHRYRLVTSGGGGFLKVPCQERVDKTPQVTVSAAANTIQAYAVLDAKLKQDGWTGVAWLVFEDGAWRIQHFQINLSSLAGRTPDALLALARAQQRGGHDLNAYILYAASFELAYRGPNFTLPLRHEIDAARKTLPVPPEFAGAPPFTWRWGDAAFTVRKAGPVGVGGKLDLAISQLVPDGINERGADERNRALAAAFAKAHPDYRDIFAGLVVDAQEAEGGRAFRTIIGAKELGK
jgi:hypothetical protein